MQWHRDARTAGRCAVLTAVTAICALTPVGSAAAGPSWGCASSRALDAITYRVDGGPPVALADSLGQIRSGATVQVTFTVRPGCSGLTVSLAAYTAPAAKFDHATAPAQRLLDSDSRTLGAGQASLQVTVPDCFFQVDLVRGPVLRQLGPAGTTNYYGAQRRLVASGNGGTSTCPGGPPASSPLPLPALLPPPPVIPELPAAQPSTVPSPTTSAATPTASTPSPGAPGPSPSPALGGAESSPTTTGGFLPFTGLALASQLAIVLLLLASGSWMVLAPRDRRRPLAF